MHTGVSHLYDNTNISVLSHAYADKYNWMQMKHFMKDNTGGKE